MIQAFNNIAQLKSQSQLDQFRPCTICIAPTWVTVNFYFNNHVFDVEINYQKQMFSMDYCSIAPDFYSWYYNFNNETNFCNAINNKILTDLTN